MRGSALHAPGWVQLVLAGKEEHPLVTVGIEDARVAPEPRSVDGPLSDHDAGRAQSGHVVVERCQGREFEAARPPSAARRPAASPPRPRLWKPPAPRP